jgi:hypothetical protein
LEGALAGKEGDAGQHRHMQVKPLALKLLLSFLVATAKNGLAGDFRSGQGGDAFGDAQGF